MNSTVQYNKNCCVKPNGCSFFCVRENMDLQADVMIVASVFVLFYLCLCAKLSLSLCIIILALLCESLFM